MHIILAYIGMFCGIFLEGEMVMISSVIAAHHGYLNFWLVIPIGIIGTYTSDCFYFFLGKKRGREWLFKNPKTKNKALFIEKKVEKYPTIVFVTYRFLYGFRTITPLLIGASNVKTLTFLFYSGLSTAIWAGIYCTIGYMFGALIKSKLGHIEHIEKYIIGVLVLFGTLFIILKHIIKKHK